MRRTVLAVVLAVGVALPVVTVTSTAASAAPAAVHVAHSAHSVKKATVFAAAGTVTAVDATAGTVTLYARNGTKNVRRQTITVAVPATARVRVNGKPGTLEAVAVGYRVDVAGRSGDGTLTALAIVARGKVKHSEPSDDSGDDD